LLFIGARREFMDKNIRVITIQMDLAIPNNECDCVNKDDIVSYLNKKLYEDPEFFGDFGPENLIKIDILE
jgi:hypothetical protein